MTTTPDATLCQLIADIVEYAWCTAEAVRIQSMTIWERRAENVQAMRRTGWNIVVEVSGYAP